jgi:hypothetical protein
MREWMLTLTLAVGLTAIGCSGGGDEVAGKGEAGEAKNGVA